MRYFFAQDLKNRSYLIAARDEEEAMKLAAANQVDGVLYELTPDRFDVSGFLING